MIGGMIGNFIGGKVVELIRGKKGNEVKNIRYGVGPGGLSVNVGPAGSESSPGENPFIGKDDTSSGFIPDKNTIQPGGSNDAKSLKDRMVSAYQRYAQLLSEGKGETAEGQQALQEYKQAFNAYEEFMSKNQAASAESSKTEAGKSK